MGGSHHEKKFIAFSAELAHSELNGTIIGKVAQKNSVPCSRIPTSLFLSQVVLQYAKTILLLKVRQHNFNSQGDPYMSSLTFLPATLDK